MLFDQYGGRKAIREVIRTGRLAEVNLGQPERKERAEIPQRGPRHGPTQKAELRAKYFRRLVGVLEGVSAASSEEVERQRLLRNLGEEAGCFRGWEGRDTHHTFVQSTSS